MVCKKFKRTKSKYDYIILDLPPAWNLLTKNGVAVADKVISPMEPSRFGYESHTKVLQSVSTLKMKLLILSVVNHMLAQKSIF
uniref:ParA family protein n=1 Tax=Lactococcus sp. TaxID=44273 RepID=UPI003241C5A2